MLRDEGDRLSRVVVCTPQSEYFRVRDRHAHHFIQTADPDKALWQHEQLKAALARFGAEVIDSPELSGHPNSVFTRDTAVVTPDGYIQARMGLATRQGEETWMAAILESEGERRAGVIEGSGTVEGGDVILAGLVAFIGCSTRTNEIGFRQISDLVRGMGYQVRSITVPHPYLHIGGAMSVIGPQRILCCKGVFPDNFFRGFDTIEISPGTFASGNVICLGERELIAEVTNREAIEKLGQAGFNVHPLDLSEFTKGTGGPSCLILPVRRK